MREQKKWKVLAALAMSYILLATPMLVYAACTQAIPTQTKGNFLTGLYEASDTYKMAFFTTAASYGASTQKYATSDEITGTNYSAGGYTLSGYDVATSGTTYWLDWDNISSSSVTFNSQSNCAMIYDDTSANGSCTASEAPWACCSGSGAGNCDNAVLGVFTFTAIQPQTGTLTVTFPTPDASNAIIRIAGLTGEEWNMANAIYDQDRRLYAYLREAILGPGPWLLEE